MFVQALKCRPAKEQDEFHTQLAECESLRRAHCHAAISAASAFSSHQNSANPRDGHGIRLNFHRLPDEPDMTNRLHPCDDDNVLLRGSPLQLVRAGLTRIVFLASQFTAIRRGITLDDANFDTFLPPGGFRLLTYFRHGYFLSRCAPKIGD
jgi:hypothetical protein